jgi:hypothetical protein
MTQKKRAFFILLLSVFLLGIGLLFVFLVTKGFKIFCPIYKLTGIRCPGCGNTRATFALLRLDFRSLLHFNFLYPLEMLYLARIYILCAINFIRRGRFCYHTRPDWVDIACLASILLWAVVRNVIGI